MSTYPDALAALAELEQILPWLEGGERPLWYDLNP
jgi:hypothetical protein